MDQDNPNLNNASHDHKEWWESYKAEQQAKIDKMEASKKMEANNAFNDLSTEVEGAAEWTAAQWDEFKAKATKWSNDLEVNVDEAI